MFIILKHDHITNKKEVLTVIYSEKADTWVKYYLNDQKSQLENCDKKEDDKKGKLTIKYVIEENEKTLTREEIYIEKGYLYDNTIIKKFPIISLEMYEYNAKCLEINKNYTDSRMWENLNKEINHRVLKSMDKDSLYQVFITIDNNLKLKDAWSTNDYINILNDILKGFKKEMYSSIAKKLKRYRLSH
jgi:hypothetical protein